MLLIAEHNYLYGIPGGAFLASYLWAYSQGYPEVHQVSFSFFNNTFIKLKGFELTNNSPKTTFLKTKLQYVSPNDSGLFRHTA